MQTITSKRRILFPDLFDSNKRLSESLLLWRQVFSRRRVAAFCKTSKRTKTNTRTHTSQQQLSLFKTSSCPSSPEKRLDRSTLLDLPDPYLRLFVWVHSNCDISKGGSQVMFKKEQESLRTEEGDGDLWVKQTETAAFLGLFLKLTKQLRCLNVRKRYVNHVTTLLLSSPTVTHTFLVIKLPVVWVWGRVAASV